MKKTLLLFSSLMLSSISGVCAQTHNTSADLPNISVIGNFLGSSNANQKDFSVKEIEISFQDHLHPSINTNVFAAIHKEDGKHILELDEAYVTFSDLIGVTFPNSPVNPGIGAIVGKKLLSIGKINSLHPEQWHFVDKPLTTQQFLGGKYGLSGEGAQLSYLLPLPFFSQVELGYWSASKQHANEGVETEIESHGIEYENTLFAARLWNSIDLSDTQELEIGFSKLFGNISAKSNNEKQELQSLDITFTQKLRDDQFFKVQAEYYQSNYGEEGEAREKQNGAYISSLYQINRFYQVGLQFDTLGTHGYEGNTKERLIYALTKQLTDTSKIRLQYNTGKDIDNTIYLQFIFGIGPHLD